MRVSDAEGEVADHAGDAVRRTLGMTRDVRGQGGSASLPQPKGAGSMQPTRRRNRKRPSCAAPSRPAEAAAENICGTLEGDRAGANRRAPCGGERKTRLPSDQETGSTRRCARAHRSEERHRLSERNATRSRGDCAACGACPCEQRGKANADLKASPASKSGGSERATRETG